MDRWAVRYAGRASFVCACCDGPGLAETFASELRLRHCTNVWVDRAGMPSWGQLGCQGFIVCDGRGAVTCRATSAFLDVEGRAFEHVETLLEALLSDGGGGSGDAPAAAAAIRPGAVCELHSLVARPDLNGCRVVCVKPAGDASGGRCIVRTAEGRGMKVKPANLRIVDPAAQGCCGGGCSDEKMPSQKTSCDQKASCDEAGCGEKRKADEERLEAKGKNAREAPEAVRAKVAPPAVDPAEPRPAVPAKREAFKGGMSLGVCANDLCFCADCECGRGCTCNVASKEVEQADTCDPCTDFRRQKKAAGGGGGGAPAAEPACATTGRACATRS